MGPELKPDAGTNAIPATGPVGLAFTVAILVIFLTGMHPARWFLAASIVLGLSAALILRLTSRSGRF
jgi:hypothetical protein